MPSRRARRPDDGRLAVNKTPRRPRAPKSRYQQLIDGELTVHDLDDDEIMAGRCKNKNGEFTGRPPDTMPRAISDALRMEFKQRMDNKWRESAELAWAVMNDIMTNPRASSDARFKAAQYITERSQGKVPDKVDQTVILKKFEEDVAGLFVDIDEDKADNVVPINRKKEA